MFEKFGHDFYINFIKDDRYMYLLRGLGNTLLIPVLAVLLGIVVGILETVLIVWTIYAFNIFRDLGTLGQVIVDYTRDSRILTCLYENNYLAYLVEQLGQKLPIFVK